MLRWLTIVALLASPAGAHLGSPDIFFEGNAGAYPLFVTIRPPMNRDRKGVDILVRHRYTLQNIRSLTVAVHGYEIAATGN